MDKQNSVDIVVSVFDDICNDRYGCGHIEACVNGELVADGYVGGEPEDNSYYRDYDWIDGMVKAVAQALGANVNVVQKSATEF